MGQVIENLFSVMYFFMSDDYFFENNFGVNYLFNLDDYWFYEVVVVFGVFYVVNMILCVCDVYGDKLVVLDDVVFLELFILEEG